MSSNAPDHAGLTPGLGSRAAAGPGGGVQFDLAHPHDLRSHLDAFVGRAELHGPLQVELERLGQCLDDVRGRGPDIGQLLLAGDVDVEILWARVDSDDHALVGVLAGFDEELPAIGELKQRERRDGAGPVGYQRPGVPGPDLPRPWAVTV